MKRQKSFIRKLLCLFVLLVICLSAVSAEASRSERPIDFYAEFSRMLSLQLGMEYYFNDYLGIKGSLGASPFMITTWTYNLLGVYHFNLPAEHFQLDFEAGLPLAYLDLFEGRVTDWDPQIESPFMGFLPGVAVLASYRFNEEHALGVRLGGSVQFEYRFNGSWQQPGFIPVFALVYNF